MSRRARWAVVAHLVWALWGTRGAAAPALPAAAGADPRRALDACLVRRGGEDPEADGGSGLRPLAGVCPELVPYLQRAPWSSVLPQRLPADARGTAAALTELRTLLDADLSTPDRRRAPRGIALEPVLRSLDAPHRSGWWARLRGRLERLLQQPEPQPGAREAAGWLTRLGLQAGAMSQLLRVAIGALLAAALLLLGHFVRLRLAASRGAGRRPRQAALARVPPAASRADVPRESGTLAPLAEEPRLLLEAVMRQLQARGQLADARGLTVHELLGRVRELGAADRERLAALAKAAERVRYASSLPTVPMLRAAIAGGRELLLGLHAVAGAPMAR